ncbi:MAG: M23 family metallopeptidase [Rikenellaceae bacterium]|nr:M23 family metallopeptidase [Rikenellaceae bacterium]
MALKNKVKRFFSDFRIKHKISIDDPHTEKEVWHMYLSPANIFSAVLALVIILLAVVTIIVAFTPVMDFLPGYQGNKTRNVLIENHLKLDSLEKSLEKWNEYYINLVRIMDGLPAYPTDNFISDSLLDSIPYVNRSIEDSLLRNQLEGDGDYGLSKNSGTETVSGTLSFPPPVKGVVMGKFDPESEMYGINIATAENQPVISILDGTVIVSAWTPNSGNIIFISHPGNMVSGYLFNARSIKKVGDRINAGDVIAFTGNADENDSDTGFIQFQLWNNGAAVDPENYIIF